MLVRMMIVKSQRRTVTSTAADGAAGAARAGIYAASARSASLSAGKGTVKRDRAPKPSWGHSILPPIPPCASLPHEPAAAHPSVWVVAGHFLIKTLKR